MLLTLNSPVERSTKARAINILAFMFFGGISGSSVGTTLFVGCAIGKISIEHAARHLWPFWLAMLVVLLLVTHIPALALWVPSLRYAGITF